jgi:plasmid maintenance system killer protein
MKLILLNRTESETDLLITKSNRIEHLKGKRKSEYSIRINDQLANLFQI